MKPDINEFVQMAKQVMEALRLPWARVALKSWHDLASCRRVECHKLRAAVLRIGSRRLAVGFETWARGVRASQMIRKAAVAQVSELPESIRQAEDVATTGKAKSGKSKVNKDST